MDVRHRLRRRRQFKESLLFLLSGPIAILTCIGCSQAWPNNVGAQICLKYEELPKLLSDVTDLESAKAVLPRLEAWQADFGQLHSKALEHSNRAAAARAEVDQSTLKKFRSQFDAAAEKAKREDERLGRFLHYGDDPAVGKVRKIVTRWYKNPF
ncbi:MAG TPA: hypothetical protein VHC19_18700 [Pirellulales bacterium]|jgi:hypothetical protein|nr:hypothetical protein [Pirellulales bacterium]